nr:hypothetical protein [Tanacetum cinerariifolium]
MLTSVGVDAKNGICRVAYAIVEAKTKSSCDLDDEVDSERRKILKRFRKKGKHSLESRRKLEIIKNDNERVRTTCVGTIPTYSSFDPNVEFSQASVGGPIIREREDNGKLKEKSPSGNLMKGEKVVGQTKNGKW